MFTLSMVKWLSNPRETRATRASRASRATRNKYSPMKKKVYIVPLCEVMQLGSGILMEAFGPGSMPRDPFSAPVRRTTDVF